MPAVSHVTEIQAGLAARADEARRAWWEHYVKGATFRGVAMADVRAVVGEFVADHPETGTDERKALAAALVREPLSDDKRAGILLLAEHLLDELSLADLAVFEKLLAGDHLGDWDSCDWFCVKVLGQLLRRSPDAGRIADVLVAWTARDHLWLRRAGLVGFVTLAPKGDELLPGLTGRVLAGAANNVADPRRFAQTSVGWTLRELSEAQPREVAAFVARHGQSMSAEARRAATARLPSG